MKINKDVFYTLALNAEELETLKVFMNYACFEGDEEPEGFDAELFEDMYQVIRGELDIGNQ